MPTYEYECDSCGIMFERFQKISDDPLRECPECGGTVRRLISTGGGLVFKGPGFYATDYRSGGAKGSAASDSSGSEGGGTGKKGTKADSGAKGGSDGGD